MNRKGQMEYGMIIVVAVTLIIGVILFQVIAQQAGSSTNTDTLTNVSIGTQTNGTTYYFDDYRSVTDVVMVGNGTGTPVILASDNYTITNNVINPTTNSLAVSLEPSSLNYSGTTWNITATVQPTTYVTDSGARAVINLIAIFFALGIVVVAILPTARSGVMNIMKG